MEGEEVEVPGVAAEEYGAGVSVERIILESHGAGHSSDHHLNNTQIISCQTRDFLTCDKRTSLLAPRLI